MSYGIDNVMQAVDLYDRMELDHDPALCHEGMLRLCGWLCDKYVKPTFDQNPDSYQSTKDMITGIFLSFCRHNFISGFVAAMDDENATAL